MNAKRKEKIREKAADLLIELAKLIFGGVILASIITENIDRSFMYAVGMSVCIIFIISGFLIYSYTQKKK